MQVTQSGPIKLGLHLSGQRSLLKMASARSLAVYLTIAVRENDNSSVLISFLEAY